MSSVWASGITSPVGLAAIGNYMYASNITSNTITRIQLSDPTIQNLIVVGTEFQHPIGLLYNGYLYILISSGTIVQFDATTGTIKNRTWATGLGFSCYSMVVHGDYMYVSSQTSLTATATILQLYFGGIMDGQIKNASWATGFSTTIIGLVIQNNFMYVADYFNNCIYKILFDSNGDFVNKILWVSGLLYPNFLLIYGYYIYVSQINGTICQINLENGTIVNPLWATGLLSPKQMVQLGGYLYVSEFGADRISRFILPPITVPNAPIIIEIISGNQKLFVYFIPPTNDGGTPITGYQYSTNNGSTFSSTVSTTSSPLEIDNLVNGTPYQVIIRAVNLIGAGALSNEVDGTPSATVPDAPTIDLITPKNQKLTVYFTPPSDDGGSAITGYQYSTDGGSTFSSTISTTTNSIQITGLTNSTTYQVVIRAVNGVGAGASSNTVYVTTTTPFIDICFPAGTPIDTDQGSIPIENLIPCQHTINEKPIIHVSQTLSFDSYWVCFEKHALGRNQPFEHTRMSPDHQVEYKGNMVKAHTLLGKGLAVNKEPFVEDILYNVMLENYGTLCVNNLICETLDPLHPLVRHLHPLIQHQRQLKSQTFICM